LSFAGRYREAEELFKQVVEVGKMYLGDEHLDTLEPMKELASIYDSQGRHSEAEELHKRVASQ
jgi:hypothetical protein